MVAYFRTSLGVLLNLATYMLVSNEESTDIYMYTPKPLQGQTI